MMVDLVLEVPGDTVGYLDWRVSTAGTRNSSERDVVLHGFEDEAEYVGTRVDNL